MTYNEWIIDFFFFKNLGQRKYIKTPAYITREKLVFSYDILIKHEVELRKESRLDFHFVPTLNPIITDDWKGHKK